MSAFTELNWKIVLADIYSKSTHDLAFRALCLADPLAAIKQISDIDVPAGLKLQFFDNRVDYLYTFLLPPVADPQNTGDASAQQLIRWSTLCTDLTTTLTDPMR